MIQNHNNKGVAVVVYDPSVGRRLQEEWAGQGAYDFQGFNELYQSDWLSEVFQGIRPLKAEDRNLQVISNPNVIITLDLYFQGCLFEVSISAS